MGVSWLALLGLIRWLVERLLPGCGGPATRPTDESALEIFDRRLAGSEIDMDAWRAQRVALLAAHRDAT